MVFLWLLCCCQCQLVRNNNFYVTASSTNLEPLAPLGNTTEPEILVSAAFPEDNPFGHVVNGEKNKISLSVENKSQRNVTLTSVAGSFHNPDTNVVIKNVRRR